MELYNKIVLDRERSEDGNLNLGRDIFSTFKNSLKLGDRFLLKDEELKDYTPVEVVYIGRRFCNVRTDKGYTLSVNYPSLIDLNNKGLHTTLLKLDGPQENRPVEQIVMDSVLV